MPDADLQKMTGMLTQLLQPWHAAIQNPAQAQQEILHRLLKIYAQTSYGAQHGAANIGTIEDYRRAFPVSTYEDYKPLIQRVMAGEVNLLLNEEPIGWAITRGTTKGESKFVPMTPTDLKMRVSAGRAMMQYVLSTKRFDLFQGVNLNLNFPSVVGTVKVGDREVAYGYSSGIYTKYVSASTPIRSVPSQDEIDALGGGKTARDWDARFELAYQKCKEQNVTLVGGVTPTAVLFGRYLKQKHGVYPKDLWKTHSEACPASTRAISPRCTRSTDLPQSAKSTARPKGCSVSNSTGAAPGCPTTTCSSSKSRRARASRCCTRCAQARWAASLPRRRSCRATESAI
jgi:hypothetical protein